MANADGILFKDLIIYEYIDYFTVGGGKLFLFAFYFIDWYELWTINKDGMDINYYSLQRDWELEGFSYSGDKYSFCNN